MGGSTCFQILEILSAHNEIGMYHFHEVQEGRETLNAKDDMPTDDLAGSCASSEILCFTAQL